MLWLYWIWQWFHNTQVWTTVFIMWSLLLCLLNRLYLCFLTEITAASICEGCRLSNIHNYYPIIAVGVYFWVYNPPCLFKQSVLMRGVKNRTEVSANSLVVSAPTYSTTVLAATRVRFPSQGPLPILLPSLHPMLSCLLSTILSIQGIKAHKYNLKKIIKQDKK